MVKKWKLFLIFAAILFGLAQEASTSGPATISLNPATTYQTITGWEATVQASEPGQNLGDISPVWNSYKDYLMYQAVNDLGINRVRLEVQYAGTSFDHAK